MAQAESPQQPQSIQARIAALNLGQVAVQQQQNSSPSSYRRSASAAPVSGPNDIGNEPAAPELPTRPKPRPSPSIDRSEQEAPTPPIPNRPSYRSANGNGINGNANANGVGRPSPSPRPQPPPPPRLPPRKASQPVIEQPSPALPPRRPTDQLNRGESQESTISVVSSVSARSNGLYPLTPTTSNSAGRMAPPPLSTTTTKSRTPSMESSASSSSRIKAPVFDPATLPPLPPKRTQEDKDRELAKRMEAINCAKRGRPSLKERVSGKIATVRRGKGAGGAEEEEEKRPAARGGAGAAGGSRYEDQEAPPPPMPRRPSEQQEQENEYERGPSSGAAQRRLPPTTIPSVGPRPTPARARTDLSAPSIPVRPGSVATNGFGHGAGAPPPIPTSTRPDLAKLQATKPKFGQNTNGSVAAVVPMCATNGRTNGAATTTSTIDLNGADSDSCLKCRDFSAVDAHAARFPREEVVSLDILVDRLTEPFYDGSTGLPLTDQARAIFSWLHYNIDYDTRAFFGGNIQPSTPASTLQSGLAVCEGYAALFAALATKAGLEAVVVGGHGRGIGNRALAPGEPIPPESQGHAWNAVKLDDGRWKLLDPCWGAGHVDGATQRYTRAFNPSQFTTDNDEFGWKHFPQNREMQFREDGRVMTWDEYMLGENGDGSLPVEGCAGETNKEGIARNSFQPREDTLRLDSLRRKGPTVRFQFTKVCPHWRKAQTKPLATASSSIGSSRRPRPNKDLCCILLVGQPGPGNQGTSSKDMLPFETDGEFFYWADVPVSKLGAPGDTVMACTVTSLGGQSAEGLSVEEFRLAKGRKAMAFSGLVTWKLQ